MGYFYYKRIQFLLIISLILIISVKNNPKKIRKFKKLKTRINEDKPNLSILSFKKQREYIFNATKGILLYTPPDKNVSIKNKIPHASICTITYNNEKNIIGFLRSIQNIKHSSFEIVIIDDCSTDKTYQILVKEARKDSRIIVYKNMKKRGRLYSKSKAVQKARGRYIWLIDANGYVTDSNSLNILYYFANNDDLDIINFNAVCSTNPTKNNYTTLYEKNDIDYAFNKNDISYFFNKRHIFPKLFTKFIKKEIFMEALIKLGADRLNLNISTDEDIILNEAIQQKVNSYYSIKNQFYFYTLPSDIQPKENLSTNKKIKLLKDKFYVLKYLYDISNNTFENTRQLDYYLINFLNDLHTKIENKFNITNKDLKNILKIICNQFINQTYLILSRTNLENVCLQNKLLKSMKTLNNHDINLSRLKYTLNNVYVIFTLFTILYVIFVISAIVLFKKSSYSHIYTEEEDSDMLSSDKYLDNTLKIEDEKINHKNKK